MRAFFSLIIVSFIIWKSKIDIGAIKKEHAPYLFIRCLSGFVGFAIEFFALKFTDMTKVIILLYNPFLASIVGYILIGETVTKHDIFCFIIGVTGIALVTDPFSEYKGMNDFIGIALALLSATLFNIGFISLRKVKKEINSWNIVFYFMILNCFFSPICILAENSITKRHTYFDFFEGYTMLLLLIIGLSTVFGNYCVN